MCNLPMRNHDAEQIANLLQFAIDSLNQQLDREGRSQHVVLDTFHYHMIDATPDAVYREAAGFESPTFTECDSIMAHGLGVVL